MSERESVVFFFIIYTKQPRFSKLYTVPSGPFFSILFAFSAIKGPVKQLRLSFMSGEKYMNKTFWLFSGSESA